MAQREGDDPLLNKQRELVRHPRPAGAHVETAPFALPALAGGPVHTEKYRRQRDPDPLGEVDDLQPVAEEDVVLRHPTRSFRLASKRD